MIKTSMTVFLSVAMLTFSVAAQAVSDQTKKALFIEFRITESNGYVKSTIFRVPADHDFKESLIGGGYATTGATGPRFSEYEFYVLEARKIGENETAIDISAKYKNAAHCNSHKNTTILNDQRTKIKLECRVRVYAFYAPDNLDKSCYRSNLLLPYKDCRMR
jgi:hypothetical protein